MPARHPLTRRLEIHIQERLGGQVRELRLVLRDNGLVLQGLTRTYYAKQLAQHAVMFERSGKGQDREDNLIEEARDRKNGFWD